MRVAACLLAVVCVSSCRMSPAMRAPVSTARNLCTGTSIAGPVMRNGVTPADSTVTQARVRWAVADLVSALNTRQVEDLAVRYDWMGNLSVRDDFFARARGAGSATSVRVDSSGTWFSDAPGRRDQTICLNVDVHWNTLGGVPSTQRFALQIAAVDDGRAAWLSRLRVNRIEQ